MELRDKIAIITGAGQGLGKEISCALAREGSYVYLIGRTEQKLRDVQDIIRAAGGSAECVVADVTDPEQMEYIDRIVEKHGKIDILVNNAGWSPHQKPLEDLATEEIYRAVATNLFAPFYLLKKTLPIFKQQNCGIIVNISSRAGKIGYPRLSAYTATKFAVEGLTQAVAKELERTQIVCFAVAPGALNTPMRQELFGDAHLKQDPAQTAQSIVSLLNGTTPVMNGESVNL